MSSNAPKVTRRTLIRSGISTAVAMPFIGTSWAQAWPSKPIKIVVGYPAGGLTDLFARAYGEYISQQVGQPVVVENRPGAGGSVGAQAVKVAPADGYTLMFTISTTMIMNRVLYKSLPYDADKDFVLISSMFAGHLPTVASKATGVTNLKEFAEYARKNKVSMGTYAAGSYSHMVVAELNKHFGLQMEAVHYRGEAPDVAGPGSGRDPGRQRQLRCSVQRAAVRRRPGDRRAANAAHEQAARRRHLPGAGRQQPPVHAQRLHLLRRPDGDAAGDRAAPVGSVRRRGQERARAASCSTPSASTSRRSGTRSSAASTTRKARSGSAWCRAWA